MLIRKRWVLFALWAIAPLASHTVLAGGPGDCDGDSDIDLVDFATFQICFTGPGGGPLSAECECADFDGDDDIDLADFNAFQLAFTGPGVPIVGTDTELGGHSLGAYPFFQYVLANNVDEGWEVAIDPTRFPEIVGVTGDIYIVESKTALGWSGDASLTDVRGAPQTETFGGATIQDNTFAVASPFDLSADAGIEVGHPYDIVLDMDQDGMLSAGDFIDGRGDVAGFYVVHDISDDGPLAITEVQYSGGSFLGQDTYYPNDIATMGELPLVTMSHGNGHQYIWYDYLGEHLASYGYVFMSHQNNTGPGIESASETTITNTDYFVGNLDTIQSGIFEGHIDVNRITWIGHSRGGEGVARAYTRVRDGLFVPDNFTFDQVKLVSSIAPNNSLGPGQTEPGRVNYHLLWGSADGDISGEPTSAQLESFSIFERAIGFRQSTYVHGADHNDFNCCGFEDFEGPPGTAIGRPEAQQVAKGVYLGMIEHYIDGNVPMEELLWRQYEDYKPIGVMPTTTVVSDYNEPKEDQNHRIEDYQINEELNTSSSGGAVSFDVNNVVEDRMFDIDGSYAWTGAQPMNGMSRSSNANDNTRGGVFDYSTGGNSFMEFEVTEGNRDFSDDKYLQFRACQGTQHPETVAELGDLDWTVSLIDGDDDISSINFGVYGGGIEEPYQRTGGFQNEFEVIRIRLTDFLTNGSGVDLSDIQAVRFDFGAAWGSAEGRIGLDDLQVTNDRPVVGLLMQHVGTIPAIIESGQSATVRVLITPLGEDSVVEGSPMLNYRYDGGIYQSIPLIDGDDSEYEADLPVVACGDMPEFYFSAEGAGSGTVTLPAAGEGAPLTSTVYMADLFFDNFESDLGWTTEVLDGASSGFWERGIPVDDPGWEHDPVSDSDGSGQCYLTQNQTGNTDVDGGAVRLTSPTIDMSNPGAVISYDYFLRLTIEDGIDRLLVEINTNDGAGAWTEVAVHDTDGGLSWRSHQITQADLADAGVVPTSTTRLRFTANDTGTASIVEAGLDAFLIYEPCE
jgi:hypothetical protein